MPETLAYTTWQDWVDRADTEQRLVQYARGDTADSHPRVTEAEAAAIGEMGSYLRKRGYRFPLPVPLPPHLKAHLVSIGMMFLTARSESPVGKEQYQRAITYLQRVADGQATLTDETIVPSTERGVIWKERRPDWDFDSSDSPGSVRRPPI